MQSSNPNGSSIEEVLISMRDNLLRTQSQAHTTAINGFDNMVGQLKIFAEQVNQKSKEIERLTTLCKKHNIDTTSGNKLPTPKEGTPKK